ncbi:MAG: quinolinate synthase NadA [Planctomycetes bacterium]|nr:quinolinate synthase NadA [Planctomycetota bacterium]
MTSQTSISTPAPTDLDQASGPWIDPSLDLFEEIEKLKKERKAVVLAHYYQDADLQDIADVLGDSLQLAQAARARKDAEVILFLGVHFMAETAKILCPEKTVVLPDLAAGCSLADACPADKLAAWRKDHPDHVVVTYINSTAATKAESDWICTSSNAKRIIEAIPRDQPILFAPDQNLGAWLAKTCEREMDLWPGSCIVHITFSERQIVRLKAEHPDAEFIAHPECEDNVLRHADFVGSTSRLLERVATGSSKTFIVGTETGILHEMRRQAPDKVLIPAPVEARDDGTCGCQECPYMKLNTLEKAYLALRDGKPSIELDEDLRQRALVPLERMLSI